MAKLDKEVVASLIKLVTTKVEGELVDHGSEKMRVYYLDDVTLTFRLRDKPVFLGLVFEALGRDFTVISSLELIVSGEDEDGNPTSFTVEEPGLIDLLNDYLRWRQLVLDQFEA